MLLTMEDILLVMLDLFRLVVLMPCDAGGVAMDDSEGHRRVGRPRACSTSKLGTRGTRTLARLRVLCCTCSAVSLQKYHSIMNQHWIVGRAA